MRPTAKATTNGVCVVSRMGRVEGHRGVLADEIDIIEAELALYEIVPAQPWVY
jgi:hypothetical protein